MVTISVGPESGDAEFLRDVCQRHPSWNYACIAAVRLHVGPNPPRCVPHPTPPSCEASWQAEQSAELVNHGTLKVYPGAPRGMYGEFRTEFGQDLLAFIAQ
ncbi:hypothetical protein [Microbacterium sp. SS28]|uniref:hypothetical protein n=1 Tax=Microbacterium sp. SS28 TaxID=2919948 RepID=UPI001FAAC091|nr:hypothetical protein [Microbacterium sp. SS28]